MAEFLLSERAERDLAEIYEYTDLLFGPYQAEAYLAGLDRTFDLLANFPRIGTSADELVEGFRRFRFQAHIVYYEDISDYVVIRAVLHHSREIKKNLFD